MWSPLLTSNQIFGIVAVLRRSVLRVAGSISAFTNLFFEICGKKREIGLTLQG